MPEAGEAIRPTQVEKDARSVLLPAIIPIFLDEALRNTDIDPQEHSESLNFGEGFEAGIENLNFCPALTSTYAIYGKAKSALSNSALLEGIITEEQREIFEKHIEWSAVSPDHHFKNNFMTSYPAFALGYVYEMIYAGDVPKPTKVEDVIELLKNPELDELLLMGMHGVSGVSWNQGADTRPWGIFRHLRDVYDYGDESPFVTDPDGSRKLKPEIIERFHAQMRERNQKGEHVAVGCPVAVKTIHNLSDDPESPRHLTEEQLARLLETSRDSEPIASKDGRGTIRIKMDVLARLREFFVGFTENYIQKNGIPVLVEARPWDHKSTVRFIKPGEEVPETTTPEPREDCKSLTSSPFGMPVYELCDCAEAS